MFDKIKERLKTDKGSSEGFQLRGLLYRKFEAMNQKQLQEELPGFTIKKPKRLIEFPTITDITQINITYSIIEPFAYVNIKWNPEKKELNYNVIEPQLTEEEKELLRKISEGLIELVEVELSAIKEANKAIEYLESNVIKVIKEFGLKVSSNQFIKLMYYVYRNFLGFNEIEVLLQDPNIEDISCDGVGTPIYIIHRKYGSLKTNMIFEDVDKLREFVIKLAERTGRYVSYAEPILSGTLPDGSRVSATLAGDVATHGPTFTIRKFGEKPISPTEQIELGTVSSDILAYFWYLVEHGVSLLIVGGVATGKTSLLNTICMFIPPESKIVSIEDTRELKIPHEHWIPGLARVGFGIPMPTGEKYGEVTLFDLLKESFRQNPDYVIVGEVRGAEAYVMFQGMSSIPSWEKVVILNDNHWKKLPIGDITNKEFKTFSLDLKTKNICISPIKAKYIHKPRRLLFKLTTNTGREVFVTSDHSVFTFDEDVRPIRVEDLKIGSKIVIPAKLPYGFNDIEYLNLPELLPEIRIFAPNYVKRAVEVLGYYEASKIVGVKSISDYYANFRRNKPSSLVASKFFKLMKEAKIGVNLDDLKVKFTNKSKSFPAKLQLTNELLRLLGYYTSEGCLNQSGTNRRISLYNQDEKVLDDMRLCLKKVANIKPKERNTNRGFSWATELAFNHRVLFELFKNFCGKNSNERKISEFIFGLSKEKIAQFLSGLYTGDGWFVKRSKGSYLCGYSTQSKQLADDLLHLLLTLGIVAKVKDRRDGKRNRGFEITFNRIGDLNKFIKYVTPVNMPKITLGEEKKNKYVVDDIYIDKIKEIKKIELEKPEAVYDLSIMGKQNFIGGFGGILLHNSGHPSISTFHAGSIDTVIKRLTTPPIELSPTLIESLDVIAVMIHAREKGKSARRVKEVVEIISVDPKTNEVVTNPIFRWSPTNDAYEKIGESVKVQKIAVAKGGDIQDAYAEIERRKRIIEWLRAQNIKDFKEVTRLINLYYKEPRKLFEMMREKYDITITVKPIPIKRETVPLVSKPEFKLETIKPSAPVIQPEAMPETQIAEVIPESQKVEPQKIEVPIAVKARPERTTILDLLGFKIIKEKK